MVEFFDVGVLVGFVGFDVVEFDVFVLCLVDEVVICYFWVVVYVDVVWCVVLFD